MKNKEAVEHYQKALIGFIEIRESVNKIAKEMTEKEKDIKVLKDALTKVIDGKVRLTSLTMKSIEPEFKRGDFVVLNEKETLQIISETLKVGESVFVWSEDRTISCNSIRIATKAERKAKQTEMYGRGLRKDSEGIWRKPYYIGDHGIWFDESELCWFYDKRDFEICCKPCINIIMCEEDEEGSPAFKTEKEVKEWLKNKLK